MKKLIIISLALFSSVAFAGTSSKSFISTASIQAVCKFSVDNMSFGVIPVGRHEGTTNLSVLCSNKTQYSIAMAYPIRSQGNWGGIYASGMMVGSNPNNTDWINYSIKLPDGTPWGSQAGTFNGDYGTVAGSPIGVLTSTGTGTQQNFPVKFIINTVGSSPQGYIKADTYSETVTAVIDF